MGNGSIQATRPRLCRYRGEILLDRSLGVDFGFLHIWYDYGNARPGRMAPNSAFGFISIGAGILIADRVTSRSRGIGAMVVTFCVLAVGLTGLVGYGADAGSFVRVDPFGANGR